MTEKYIDLTNQIRRDVGGNLALTVANLQWLDRNPDRVPGRTLTRSDMVEAFGEEYAGWATHRLARVGYAIDPDPKPTNAEKWETFIRGTHFDVCGWTGFDATKQFAELLDEQGVKAPGGDDE